MVYYVYPLSIQCQVINYCGLSPPSRQPFIHRLLQGGAAVGMDFDKTPSTGITGAETCAFDEDAATCFFQKLHLGGGFNFCFLDFTWGNDPIWLSICLNGLKPPTGYFVTLIFPSFFSWQGAHGFQHILFMSIPFGKKHDANQFWFMKGVSQKKHPV